MIATSNAVMLALLPAVLGLCPHGTARGTRALVYAQRRPTISVASVSTSSASVSASHHPLTQPQPNWILNSILTLADSRGDESLDDDEEFQEGYQLSPVMRALFGLTILFQALPPAAAFCMLAYTAINGCGELGLLENLGLLGAFDGIALPLSVCSYLSLEAAHYVYSAASSRRQPSTQLARVEGITRDERLETWRRCLSDHTMPAEALITGWFYYKTPCPSNKRPSVELGDLRAGNVRQWLAWALAISARENRSSEEEAELDVAVSMLERVLSRQLHRDFSFPEGCAALTAHGQPSKYCDDGLFCANAQMLPRVSGEM